MRLTKLPLVTRKCKVRSKIRKIREIRMQGPLVFYIVSGKAYIYYELFKIKRRISRTIAYKVWFRDRKQRYCDKPKITVIRKYLKHYYKDYELIGCWYS